MFEGAFLRLKEVVEPHDAVDFNSTQIRDVWKSVLAIQSAQRARRSTLNMARLKPFLEAVKIYTDSIELLLKTTKFGPWVWVSTFVAMYHLHLINVLIGPGETDTSGNPPLLRQSRGFQ